MNYLELCITTYDMYLELKTMSIVKYEQNRTGESKSINIKLEKAEQNKMKLVAYFN